MVKYHVRGMREKALFIAGKNSNKTITSICFDSTCNTEAFNTWLEHVLLPALKPG